MSPNDIRGIFPFFLETRIKQILASNPRAEKTAYTVPAAQSERSPTSQ